MTQKSHYWTYTLRFKIQKETCIPMFTVALYTIARTWQQPRCPLTGKEDVVHIHNGILLSHKKEQNWIICRDVDGPRDVIHSDISQKEKKKSHNNAYVSI